MTEPNMNTYTPKQQKIADLLSGVPSLACGLGTTNTPCSIAAVNLAIYGKLSDQIPECVSPAIGKWIIRVQDACPAKLGRDHPDWRLFLPLVAGTKRDTAQEKIRLTIIMDWMWENFKQLQPQADKRGYGKEWAEMCMLRTKESARIAQKAAAYAAAAADAAYADAAYAAAYAAADAAADAACAAAYAAAYAADAAADAKKEFWRKANIPALLEKLVTAQVTEEATDKELTV